ncbi:MAG: hypothetical protein ABEK59_05295 [Halobacteria archaeon]
MEHKGDYWSIGDEQLIREAFEVHRKIKGLNISFGTGDLDEWKKHAAEKE